MCCSKCFSATWMRFSIRTRACTTGLAAVTITAVRTCMRPRTFRFPSPPPPLRRPRILPKTDHPQKRQNGMAFTALAEINDSMIYIARHLLIAGPMIGATCALLSVYVVLRRMALIAEGVSHAGFGGISIAVLMGYFFPMLDNDIWRQIITG